MLSSRTAPLVGLISLLCTSCAIAPVTRKFMKWTAESCGRATFMARLCSGAVMVVTSPVYLLTLAADLPISLIEFFGGTQLVDDPLVRTASVGFEKKVFAGRNGETWEIARMAEKPDTFLVAKVSEGKVTQEYEMLPLPDGRIEVALVGSE